MTVARSMSPRRVAKVVVEEVEPKAGGEEGGAGAVASHSRSEHREDHHEGYEFGRWCKGEGVRCRRVWAGWMGG
jgi:hypothetical protein